MYLFYVSFAGHGFSLHLEALVLAIVSSELVLVLALPAVTMRLELSK